MPHDPNIIQIESDVTDFFNEQLVRMVREIGCTGDRCWTKVIQERMTSIGHDYNYQVFAAQNQCPTANAGGWLYNHHWRISDDNFKLIRIPLVMEIEWGFGRNPIINFEKITEDFLKIVQARADLRVMVFQGRDHDVYSFTDRLIAMVKDFEGSQKGDRYLFAGYGWDTEKMHCKLWSA